MQNRALGQILETIAIAPLVRQALLGGGNCRLEGDGLGCGLSQRGLRLQDRGGGGVLNKFGMPGSRKRCKCK